MNSVQQINLTFLSYPYPTLTIIVCDCECLVVALLIQADMDTSRKTEYFYPILSRTSHDLFKFLPMNYKKEKKKSKKPQPVYLALSYETFFICGRDKGDLLIKFSGDLSLEG